MRKTLALMLILLLVPAVVTFAGRYVEDGTFYASGKLAMTRFAIAVNQGDRAKAFEMVNDGRIKSCSRASSVPADRATATAHARVA